MIDLSLFAISISRNANVLRSLPIYDVIMPVIQLGRPRVEITAETYWMSIVFVWGYVV